MINKMEEIIYETFSQLMASRPVLVRSGLNKSTFGWTYANNSIETA